MFRTEKCKNEKFVHARKENFKIVSCIGIRAQVTSDSFCKIRQSSLLYEQAQHGSEPQNLEM